MIFLYANAVLLIKLMFYIKFSQYPFKQNKNMLKIKKVLLHTYSYNISLNVLRPTFFHIYNLPFSLSRNIEKSKVKVGPKSNYFSFFMSSWIRVPKVPFRFFNKLKNEIQNSILRFCFYFNKEDEIQITDYHSHV